MKRDINIPIEIQIIINIYYLYCSCSSPVGRTSRAEFVRLFRDWCGYTSNYRRSSTKRGTESFSRISYLYDSLSWAQRATAPGESPLSLS